MQTIAKNPRQQAQRIGRFGITQPERSEYAIAGLAAFVMTLDLVLLPLAIVSFLKL